MRLADEDQCIVLFIIENYTKTSFGPSSSGVKPNWEYYYIYQIIQSTLFSIIDRSTQLVVGFLSEVYSKEAR